MQNIEIVQLERAEYAGHRLQYEYVTDSYYDVSLTAEASGWSVILKLEKLPDVVTKQVHSELFERYVENPQAYRCLSGGAEAGFIERRWRQNHLLFVERLHQPK